MINRSRHWSAYYLRYVEGLSHGASLAVFYCNYYYLCIMHPLPRSVAFIDIRNLSETLGNCIAITFMTLAYIESFMLITITHIWILQLVYAGLSSSWVATSIRINKHIRSGLFYYIIAHFDLLLVTVTIGCLVPVGNLLLNDYWSRPL